MSRGKSKSEWIRLTARVTLADYVRLRNIQRRYGFKSVYQILNYLTYSFLRVADKDNDPVDEPMPKEVEEMFDDLGTPKMPVRYKKAKPKKRSVDL